MNAETAETIETARPIGRRKRPAARTAERKPAKTAREDGRLKSTLLLPVDVDFLLTTLAASQNLDRSQFAAKLLDQGMRNYAMYEALRPFIPSVRAKSAAQATPVIGGDPTD